MYIRKVLVTILSIIVSPYPPVEGDTKIRYIIYSYKGNVSSV
jgi:hypothetical protein